MNYARPATQFDTSMYGTQPVQSPFSASGASRQNINNAVGNYFQQNPNSNINSTLAAMRSSGVNRTDIQTWGGVNNYGPSAQQPAQQTPFNPYTNNFGGFGRFMPQMQTPFQQQMQKPQGQQAPFDIYNMAPPGGPMDMAYRGGAMTPQQQQARQQFNQQTEQQKRQLGQMIDGQPMQQQMQSPFGYQQQMYQPQQQPYYGGMGGNNFIPDAPLPEGMMGTMGGAGYDPMTGRVDLGTAGGSGQYTPAPPRSSGPRQPIVGRSSQMRGTPNVMRRAEGGIAALMDDE
jgi:hypothetical protein